MSVPERPQSLCAAMRQALIAHDELLRAWRACEPGDLAALAGSDGIELLRQMVRRRIYPVNAFGALVQLDQAIAVDLLMDLYLGQGVNPDTKFGGFTFELWVMLDDLRELSGEAALRLVASDPRVNDGRLEDHRVIEAFAMALDVSDAEARQWLREARDSSR